MPLVRTLYSTRLWFVHEIGLTITIYNYNYFALGNCKKTHKDYAFGNFKKINFTYYRNRRRILDRVFQPSVHEETLEVSRSLVEWMEENLWEAREGRHLGLFFLCETRLENCFTIAYDRKNVTPNIMTVYDLRAGKCPHPCCSRLALGFFKSGFWTNCVEQ